MAFSKSNLLVSLLVIAAAPAQAFVSQNAHSAMSRTTQLNSDAGGGIEEIEFRIYPDGRVQEIVRGVKGQNCEDITAAINEQLGNVVDSQPTEEMFETEVMVEQTLENKDGTGGWEGSSSW